MRKTNEFIIYTLMWVAAVIILMGLLMQSLGDARIINYSGMVRGATQKLVKEELYGQPDDGLVETLDGIIQNLRTGEGAFGLQRNTDADYQQKLAQLDCVWRQMKEEIQSLRQGRSDRESLYNLSQAHFQVADELVLLAEQSTDQKLIRFMAVYGVVLVVSICVFLFLNVRSHRAVEHSIYTDGLTRILNRAGFEAGAASLLRQHPGAQYCLLEFDVDDFKFLNNTYGYELGDRLLCALATGLQAQYQGDQLCARIASDDFVVLARRVPALEETLRQRLTAALEQQALLNVSEFITFTVGAYELPDAGGEVIQSVLDKANMAHKRAKNQGKGLTVWYDSTLLETLSQENFLKNRMRRGLGGGEFKLYLQPKYTLSDLQLHSAEALVRWDIPGQGVVPPDQFIPLFERNGSIAEIDFYMLDRACAFIRQYMDRTGGEFSVAVNFSRVTIYQQQFYPTVLALVNRHRVPYHCIELEVTESAFNGISDVMEQKLLRLKAIGFVLSMDDFGSGYSSLSLLSKLPIQVLKIDQGFLREYERNAKVKNVISCVTDLAHTLDIRVVCEGIEQREQVSFLRSIGCDYGQGYYFSRPIPQEEFCATYELRQGN